MSVLSRLIAAARRLGRRRRPRPYDDLVAALAARGGALSVVVVGANDGKINDPMHRLMRDGLARRSRVLLIEPQTQLLPILRRNYAFHPAATVVGGAVGAPGDTAFFAVDEAWWDRLQPGYARKWPPYRAPTGATSADPERVRRWIEVVGGGAVDPDAAMTSFTVRTAPLPEILAAHGFPARLDVLQVDAEGMDDQVLAHAGLEATRPALIRYERSNLPPDRADALRALLEPCYDLIEDRSDMLCVRRADAPA